MDKHTWVCPTHGKINKGVVCGGDLPFTNHDSTLDPSQLPNLYFYADLDTGKMLKEPFGLSENLTLTNEDWANMHEHAAGGCIAEPQCPWCGDYLTEDQNG